MARRTRRSQACARMIGDIPVCPWLWRVISSGDGRWRVAPYARCLPGRPGPRPGPRADTVEGVSGEDNSKQPRWTQTWIGGARAAGVDLGRPGQRLGLPAEGSGSVSGFGRRIGAILIDWLICVWAIAQGLLGVPPAEAAWAGLLIFAVENILLVGTIGMTFGMRLMNIRVVALDGGRPGVPGVLIRTLLLCLAVPALVWDRDNRGLHDRAAGTVVVRL